MFATTQIIAMSLGFPDVCKTIVGVAVVPVPYPNIALSMSHIPNNLNQFFGGGSVHNLLTPGTLSSGDEAGAAMGLVSNIIKGPDQYVSGSVKVFNGVAPTARLTSPTINNGINAIGIVIVPSINRVIILL